MTGGLVRVPVVDDQDDGRLRDVVARSRAPVMILEAPSQQIVFASPGAVDLLGDIAHPLVGRNVEEFLEGDASGAMPLLAAGRITGYEAVRVLRGTDERRRLWIQALSGTSTVLAVLLREDVHGRPDVPWLDDDSAAPVIGSIDVRLVIDRISSDVHGMVGLKPDQVVGTSFLGLIQQPDLAAVLSALGQTTRHREGITLRVGVLGVDSTVVSCQLVLLPIDPPPSSAFALLADDSESSTDGKVIAALVTRLGRGIRGASASHAVASAPVGGDVDLGRLSSRELEIVTRLLAGDRVPSIARTLFLSQGTVRNYLSAAYGKLGVATQQELIELFRPPPATVTS